MSLLVLLATACSRDELDGDSGARVPDGYVAIRFGTDVPEMQQVVSRSVDSDGGGIQDMYLFCFSESGAFISTVKAEIVPGVVDPGVNASLTGTFSANVPDYTRIIHFVANQNLTGFNEIEMGGKHETELMATLVASPGRMIYWQRVECQPGEKDMAAALGRLGDKIEMVRNQARIQVMDPENNGYVEVLGYTLHNTNAFGTVAPYNAEAGNFEWSRGADGYLSLPSASEQQTLKGEEDGSLNLNPEYAVECLNDISNPLSVILHGIPAGGGNALYYRVLLLDDNAETLPVRRNHSYNITIMGPLTNGYATFGEALEGTPTNNVWISIPDDINEVSDGTYRLSVDETFVVFPGTMPQSVTVNYKYEKKNASGVYEPVSASEVPDVQWVTATTVAGETIRTEYDGNTGVGTLTISLNQLSANEAKREGIIRVKAGKLQRMIKVITLRDFTFSPAWVSTQIYADMEGQPVTLMFSIPEDFPRELLPLRVKIGADWLNVRQSTGQQLSTVTPINSPGDFNGEDDWNFKFVYEATHTGVQRVYFNTVLKPESDGQGGYKSGTITIEADNFTRLEKVFPFSENNYYITLDGLISVDGSTLDDEMPNGETVYYCLVPQKKNAPVNFEIQLRDGSTGQPVASGNDDAFLLYSQYLTRLDDDEIPGGAGNKECDF